MNKTNFLLLHFGTIIIAVVIILYLYPITHHTGGMYLPVPKKQIEERAAAFLDSLNVHTTDLTVTTGINVSRTLHTYVLQEYGLSEGNTLLRDSIPAFYWNIRWTNPGVTIGMPEDSDEKWRLPDIRVQYDGHGNLTHLQKDISDTVYIAGIDAVSARVIAEGFLIQFTQHDPDALLFQSHEEVGRQNRLDHIFHWESTQGTHSPPYTIQVDVAGSIISQYNLEFDMDPALTGPTSTQGAISIISSSILYVIIAIMMLVIGVIRFRSQEIGLKNGVLIGIIVAFLFSIYYYIQYVHPQLRWETLIPLLLFPLFVGLFIVFIVVVSEAIGRNTWKEKFIPFDLVTNGYIFHSTAGKSYIRGITYGIAVFSASLIIIRIVDVVHPVWYTWLNDNPLGTFSPPYTALKIMLHEFLLELIGFCMMLLFLVSYLRQRISTVAVLIIIAALIYGIGDWRFTYPTFPPVSGILIASLYGLFFVWILYRFDVVSAYFAMLTFSVAVAATALIMSGNDYFISEGIIIASVFGGVYAAGIVSQFTPDTITDYEDIAPVFQKYISERERLQRELEIAHDVQMSFLPKKTPDIPGLDIASTCIPAHEVGGDYYDFISINDHLFGVVIGDVSGKGTKASFYMTLTKGILHSTAHNETDPAEVLRKVNRTFYEISERGAFISMVYGIFDTEKKTLTVARAGHNPVILWKSAQANGEMINPKGIALGLDGGQVFDKSIYETTVTYERGDVFIFYTDGFSEAANKRNEDFGDDRLFEVAKKYHKFPAEVLLEGIISETNQFTGKTPQRDDMTMVVVKIK